MKSNTSAGFSYIEIIMTTLLIGIVILGVAKFSQSFFSGYTFTFDEGVAIDHAQSAIQSLEKELREMRTGEDGSYPLSFAGDQEIVFFGDVDDDGVIDRVRYYLVGTDLIKQIYPYLGAQNYACVGGCDICHEGNTITIPETAWPAHNAHTTDYLGECVEGGGQTPGQMATERVVASYIDSSVPLFAYYNGDWPSDTTNNPLPPGQRLLNSRLIRVSISVDTNPDSAPQAFFVSTMTHLRNLKDNL